MHGFPWCFLVNAFPGNGRCNTSLHPSNPSIFSSMKMADGKRCMFFAASRFS